MELKSLKLRLNLSKNLSNHPLEDLKLFGKLVNSIDFT